MGKKSLTLLHEAYAMDFVHVILTHLSNSIDY